MMRGDVNDLAARRMAERNVSPVSNEALFRRLIDSLTEYAIFAVSETGSIVSWNAGAEHLFGFAPSEVIQRNFEMIFTPEDRFAGAPLHELTEARSAGRASHDRWHVRKDGTRFWATNIVQPFRDDHGALAGYTKIVRDATERYTATEVLRASQERFRLLVETVREYALFAVSPEGNISVWNAGARLLFGYEEEEIVGMPVSMLYTPEDAHRDVGSIERERMSADGFFEDERWLMRKDGSRFFASSRSTQIHGDDAPGSLRGFVKVAYDISDRKRSEEALRELALHDSLTGLPNRLLFIDHLQTEIMRAKRRMSAQFAVFFLDVDDFKLVNDSLGHTVADRFLQALATRLAGVLREADVFARLGGDEFAILLTDVKHASEAEALVRRIDRALAMPFQVDQNELFMTASIGIAIDTAGYTKPDDALRDADIAMYVAKAKGRGKFTMFEPAMREAAVARQRLGTQLRRGLDREEFFVSYQAIVDLADARTIGFETLIRWRHPTRGLLIPSDFLEVARQTDLLVAIDRFVLRTACLDASAWHAEHADIGAFLLSVNTTARQFETIDFVSFVTDVLRETGFPPACLKLEITESTMMEKSQRVSESIERLRALGVQLYIDDFGTGYSSLSYLADLPVNALKIDQSFVTNIGTRVKQDNIVATIIDLAHGLDLKAIAEGIESEESVDALRALGCDYGQGYFFSRPVDWSTAALQLT